MHYYSEDGSIFSSKIRAIEYGRKKQQKINFYYYDDIYSKLDWTTEPVGSLDYYYKEQAQRIRDNYDYVILCYSGGSDSTNVLETFYFNNIKLDKIITVGAFGRDEKSGSDKNHNGEIYHNVFPYIKQLGLESITESIDYTKYFTDISSLSIFQHEDSWIDTSSWYSPHNWFWRDLEKYVVPKNIGNKKVAILFGKDKPGLYYIKNHKDVFLESGNVCYNGFHFGDSACTSYSSMNLPKMNSNVERINFYWDPTYPNILLKQIHVLLKHYLVNNIKYDPFFESQFSGRKTDKILYDLKRPLSFISPKSKTTIISLRDNYLYNSQDSDLYKFYISGIKKMQQSIKQEELSVVYSKFYNILK